MYYQEILETIKKAIEDNNVDLAISLAKQELNLPYVPKEFEEKLQHIIDEYQETNIKSKTIDVANDLYDERKILQTIEFLSHHNIREYLSEIQKFLKSDQKDYFKVLILCVLMEQQVDEWIILDIHDIIIELNPCHLYRYDEQDNFLEIQKMFDEDLYQYPSLQQHCTQLLNQYGLSRFPFLIEDEEVEIIAKAIYKAVLSTYEEQLLWEKIEEKRKLKMAKDFDLLKQLGGYYE